MTPAPYDTNKYKYEGYNAVLLITPKIEYTEKENAKTKGIKRPQTESKEVYI
jgi:hypothetical protein